MPKFLVQKSAAERLKEIFAYTQQQWGDDQAHRYIDGMFDRFEQICKREVLWRPIPGELKVNGYYTVYGKHYIYWKVLNSGQVGIVTVLHERMHQLDRFRDDFEK